MKLKFFGKKKLEDNPNPNRVDYKKILSDIMSDNDFIKSQYENYIYNSLKNDFELFLSNLDENLKSTSSVFLKTHWFVKDYDRSTLTLKKCMDSGSQYRNVLNLYVSYKFDQKGGDLSIQSITGYDDLNSKRMHEIISDYIYSIEIQKAKIKTNSTKNELEKVIKVVGRDTVRDNRINEILG